MKRRLWYCSCALKKSHYTHLYLHNRERISAHRLKNTNHRRRRRRRFNYYVNIRHTRVRRLYHSTNPFDQPIVSIDNDTSVRVGHRIIDN